jgi:hypothetical protein
MKEIKDEKKEAFFGPGPCNLAINLRDYFWAARDGK